MSVDSLRNIVIEMAKSKYNTEPEQLWVKYPGYEVLRHQNNRKWYGIIMDVPKSKLGLSGEEYVDILDLKADPVMAGSFLQNSGIMPGYHMHKGNWITVLLDGSVPMNVIELLLDTSFELTSRKKARKSYTGKTEWIIPANPKYYDIETAVEESGDGSFIWKQSNNISVGDEIYLYITAPVSAIVYKCRAVEVDIPYEYSDKNVSMTRVMRLKLLKHYNEEKIDFSLLKKHGVSAVRGPRRMPDTLKYRIKELYHE